MLEPKLKSNVPLSEIIERMRHPTLGVGFLQQTVSLPSHTFVSIYAIHWLQANMEGITYDKAIAVMEVIKFIFSYQPADIRLGITRYYLTFSSSEQFKDDDSRKFYQIK